MFSKKYFGFGIVLATGLAATASAGGFIGVPGVAALVKVIGPQGELISYERNGNEIIIRECVDDASNAEIEQGCPLKPGKAETRISESDFRDLVRAKLGSMNTKNLSPEQKALLDRALNPDPNADEDARKLTELDASLKKNQQSKAENPADYNANREKDFKAQIQCIQDRQQDRQKDYAPILNAKRQVAELVNVLIGDMQDKKIKRPLRYSADKTGIAFNLLKEISSVDACGQDKTKTAAVGTLCRTSSGALWQVVARQGASTIVKDLKSGMFVSDRVKDGYVNQYDAEKLCSDPATLSARGNLSKVSWHLPSGYRQEYNGKNGFPNQDSEFVTLEKDGIREVANTNGRWFWSSSVHPNVAGVAFVFYGVDGYIGYDGRGYSFGLDAALCVGR